MAQTATQTDKDRFLWVYEDEHQRTMRVLNNYPPDKTDYKPAPNLKTARELAWVFAMERKLGIKIFNDEFAKGMTPSTPQTPPVTWSDLLAAVESAHQEFGDLIRKTSDEDLTKTSRFFVGPKTMGDIRRIDVGWFLIQDEVHHRGQFSIYLRAAGGKVPSIYGPSGDEPWT